jgi:putative transposase
MGWNPAKYRAQQAAPLQVSVVKYDPDKHHRRSIRLQGYDYSRSGAYFVTICAAGRECLFGDVLDGIMHVNDAGRMVQSAWDGLPQRFPGIDADASIVMPNHFHGIIVVGTIFVGAPLAAPRIMNHTVAHGQGAASSPPTNDNPDDMSRRVTIGDVMRAFKSISAITVNRHLNRSGQPLWQRNYYEHIIRTPESLDRIRQYIIDNPARWAIDRDNPQAAETEQENAWLSG